MSHKFDTRILVADSDELSLALIKTSLETQDIAVASALDCDTALRHAVNGQFNLVISDCEMQTSTGVPLEMLIHSIPEQSDLPFLFTSARQKPDVISRRRNDRNVFFIRKPFDHEAFLELVEFAMWMPHLIRSHIERVHEKQGLSQPHAPMLPPMMPQPMGNFSSKLSITTPVF